jgi:hypothetical protein
MVRHDESFGRYVMGAYPQLRRRAGRWNGERPTHPVLEGPADEACRDVDLSAAVRRAPLALLRSSPGTVESRSARALAALRNQGLLAEEGLLQ